MGFLAGVVILCVASTAFGARGAYRDGPGTLNVLNYGAAGDGQSDDSGAFLKTWEAACKGERAGGTPTVVVPAGKSFLLRPLHFQGPCKSAIKFQILGNITAPTQMEEWQNCESGSWILFSEVTHLTVSGGGTGVINGRGQIWWEKDDSHLLPQGDDEKTCQSPKAITFRKTEHIELSRLTHLDSPRVHIKIENSTHLNLQSLKIIAPDESPNTDGIAISDSSNIQIHNSIIGTGDDCISIKGGTSFIDINGIRCGPGHGISVGSLGYEGAHETVEEVYVKNCEFTSSQNGARIKTWEGGSGYVRGIHFENIIISHAKNPIIIDQHYCDDEKRTCKQLQDGSSVVKISNVTFRNVRGTSRNEPSIALLCAEGTGCTDVVLDNINLGSSKSEKESYADCQNVFNGRFTAVAPPVSCNTTES